MLVWKKFVCFSIVLFIIAIQIKIIFINVGDIIEEESVEMIKMFDYLKTNQMDLWVLSWNRKDIKTSKINFPQFKYARSINKSFKFHQLK